MPEDFVANMDQNIRGQKDIAAVHAAYRRSLLEEGVPEADALAMTLVYVQSIHAPRCPHRH